MEDRRAVEPQSTPGVRLNNRVLRIFRKQREREREREREKDCVNSRALGRNQGAEKLLRYYFPGVIPVAVEGAGDWGKAKPVALRLKSQPALTALISCFPERSSHTVILHITVFTSPAHRDPLSRLGIPPYFSTVALLLFCSTLATSTS
jgi:hypothetical protein